MRSSSRVPVLLVLLLGLLLALPVMASDGAPEPVQAPAIEATAGGCAPVPQGLATLLAPEAAPAWLAVPGSAGGAISVEPIAQQGPPFRRGYCKCGCGITCETDADCGPGGSCVGFITCC